MAARKLCERDSTERVITLLSLITIGRMLRLCGATGVRHKLLVDGTMIGPPFDKLYAVLPVGVAITRPSAW